MKPYSPKIIPVFSYPTTVVFVDDEASYIEHQFLEIGEKMPIKTFTDPAQALHFLNEEYAVIPLSEQVHVPAEEMLDHVVTTVDLRALHKHMYQSERFTEVSVVVVDYAMPKMNGLIFIQKLHNPHVRIILLTGEAGSDLAVEAFNEGIIHQFIPKSALKFSGVLEAAIRQHMAIYFQQQSLQLVGSKSSQAKMLYSQLSDPAFIGLFENYCEKQQCVEHYLCDSEGSFVLLNAEGHSTIFALKNEQAMKDYWDIASYADDVPPFVMTALEQHTHVPLFYRDSDLTTPPAKWTPYLHPATSLKGVNGQYYYAFLDKAKDLGVAEKDILPFNEYLDQIDALLLKKK